MSAAPYQAVRYCYDFLLLDFYIIIILSLCAFFIIRGDTEGTFFETFVFDFCVYFVLCKFVQGLILWFMDDLWFDDLRAE